MFGRDFFLRALELDDQQPLGVFRVARVDRGFGGVHRQTVHDLQRARQESRGDDPRDRVARRLECRVGGQHRLVTFDLGQEAQGDLEGNAEETLRTKRKSRPDRAERLEASAPSCATSPSGSTHLEAQHVVGGHAVLEAVRAP
jgi:hypothetical protein